MVSHTPRLLLWMSVAVISMSVLFPSGLYAAEPQNGSLNLIPCDGVENPCDYEDLQQLAINIVRGFFILAIFGILIGLFVTGFRYLTAGGQDPGIIKKARTTFLHMGLGLLFMLGAWLLINFIVQNLLDEDVDNPLQMGIEEQTITSRIA